MPTRRGLHRWGERVRRTATTGPVAADGHPPSAGPRPGVHGKRASGAVRHAWIPQGNPAARGERDPLWASLHPRSSSTTPREQGATQPWPGGGTKPGTCWHTPRLDSGTPTWCSTVQGRSGETVQVRRRAAKVLPDYMVPVTVTSVPALPLTVNGKLAVDRLPGPALPDPGAVPPSPAARNLPRNGSRGLAVGAGPRRHRRRQPPHSRAARRIPCPACCRR
jgi:hypothetical protein